MLPLLIYNSDKAVESYKQSVKFVEENGYEDKLNNLLMVYQDISQQFPRTHSSLFSGHYTAPR
jgi:hypothetical protein